MCDRTSAPKENPKVDEPVEKVHLLKHLFQVTDILVQKNKTVRDILGE